MKNIRYYPFERNRYFYGKLLTVRDFELEQKYFNDKRRLINRLLFGSGVVSGLQVIAVDDKTISVETGMAIDCYGREIVVATPVTLKLSMLEGFTNNEYAKNVYLCLAYDEKGKEPVHSVASSSARPEEVSEYNRVHEGYKLFVREEAPDPSTSGILNLVEESILIYQDKQMRIWQKTPRYVNPGQDLEVTLKVEKTLQAPRIEISYELAAEYFYPADGSGTMKITFSEPEFAQKTNYEVRYLLKAGNVVDTTGNISIKDGVIRLKVGDQQMDAPTDCSNTVQIINEPVKNRIIQNYLDRSLEQSVECFPDQCICLAKISLVHVGPTFMIEKVQRVPFDEYIYNTSLLYHLGLLGENRQEENFTARASASILEHEDQPRLSVYYNPESKQFDFQLGLPQSKEFGEVATGTAEIELEANPRTGRSYFSEEIAHGLGPGPVVVLAGIEETGSNALTDIDQYSEQIFYGDNEVFQKSHFEPSTPPVTVGTVVYPRNGTFRVGIRLQAGTRMSGIRVRWWAYKKN